MGGFFVRRRYRSYSRRGRWLNGLGVLVAFWSALCPSFALADDTVPARPSGARSGDPSHSPAARPIVASDVALQPGGVLHGVVVPDLSLRESDRSVAHVRVALLRDGKVVAETRSDESGRFSVSSLYGGKYVIAVARQGRVHWHLHRVWLQGTAPHKASAVARMVPGEGIVRSQGPLPAVSFSEAALMAAVVVGAVAAPIIYHNAQKSNRVPASP